MTSKDQGQSQWYNVSFLSHIVDKNDFEIESLSQSLSFILIG